MLISIIVIPRTPSAAKRVPTQALYITNPITLLQSLDDQHAYGCNTNTESQQDFQRWTMPLVLSPASGRSWAIVASSAA